MFIMIAQNNTGAILRRNYMYKAIVPNRTGIGNPCDSIVGMIAENGRSLNFRQRISVTNEEKIVRYFFQLLLQQTFISIQISNTQFIPRN